MILHRKHMHRLQLLPCALVALLALGLLFILSAPAHSSGPTRNGSAAALPAGLFSARPPADAITVRQARQTAQPGKPIVVHGRIGGKPKPIASKYAIFILSDERLPLCTEGCPTPWDYCCTPRETIIADLLAVRVVDKDGKALKVSLQGINGLEPGADVIVTGTTVVKESTFMMINAQTIYVPGAAKGRRTSRN